MYAHAEVNPLTAVLGWRWMRLVRQKRSRLHTRNIKAAAAPLILASCFIVQQHHVTRGLGKLCSVALIRLPRKLVQLATHQPPQVVRVRCLAKRAVQRRLLADLRLTIECALIHRIEFIKAL